MLVVLHIEIWVTFRLMFLDEKFSLSVNGLFKWCVHAMLFVIRMSPDKLAVILNKSYHNYSKKSCVLIEIEMCSIFFLLLHMGCSTHVLHTYTFVLAVLMLFATLKNDIDYNLL